jgi:hypothetical protein
MHPYLSRLGVRPEVQAFFEPFYATGKTGDIYFDYGSDREHFGFAFHRVPFSSGLWMAGNTNFSQISQVIVCSSAMDAVAWLNIRYAFFSCLDGLLFLSIGGSVDAAQLQWIGHNLSGKRFRLLFDRDIIGRAADLKLAAAIRQHPIEIYLDPEGRVRVDFRFRSFVFAQAAFSLHAFEKASGHHFNIPAEKPKNNDSFFAQLKAAAGLTL